jgi:lysozyme family protein
MPSVTLTAALRSEYERLFNTCIIRPQSTQAIESTVAKISAARGRYETAGAGAIPWFFISVIHAMEASLDFTKHLHNGDPLTAKTVQVPSGRPPGNPPFTWEVSAADALSMKGLGGGTEWSLAGTLYQLERYNGWGYRLHHPQVLTPYLWSFSNHYTSGKYISDGTWSDTAVSKQSGAAVILRRMAEKGLADFADQPVPATPKQPPLISYSMKKSSDPAVVQRALDLQAWLNTFPGVFVKLDGVPGNMTSDAFRAVTGRRLPGDPR